MNGKLRVLDLFSGIGGFSLGLERTGGFETIAFCEINPFCRKVLAKHWPDVPIHDDIRTLASETVGPIDVIAGGFPCQDVSLAGRRAGLDGERSGLWSEIARLVGELRPKFAIVENTPGLLSLGMGTVLGDLAALGYDAEWYSIPACYVGADHIRDRVWIIAYPSGGQSVDERRSTATQNKMAEDAANIVCERLQGRRHDRANGAHAPGVGARIGLTLRSAPIFPRQYSEHKPVLGRGLHGIPDRVDRVRALGNAVVPQIPEIIGRAILMGEQFSFDSPNAVQARDEALQSVTENSGRWFDRAMDRISSLPPGELTGEEIRIRLVREMNEEPHHHNAWGALVRSAIKRGYLIETGRWERMKTVKSHARKTPVYRV